MTLVWPKRDWKAVLKTPCPFHSSVIPNTPEWYFNFSNHCVTVLFLMLFIPHPVPQFQNYPAFPGCTEHMLPRRRYVHPESPCPHPAWIFSLSRIPSSWRFDTAETSQYICHAWRIMMISVFPKLIESSSGGFLNVTFQSIFHRGSYSSS